MATGRDDFVIAFRSAFLKKKDKQKFSLLTLIFLSIFVILLSNFNFKIIKTIKSGVNEIVYDMVYDVQEEPLWFSEASKYKPTSFDDSNEHAFNMMMRYINEYKRVSTFGS